MINKREYEWEDISIVLAGRLVTGVQGVSYNPKQEKEAIYGKGNKPIAIQRGNKSYEGKVTLLQSEYDALSVACGGDILDAETDIAVAYGNPSNGDVVTTDMLIGVQFTDDPTTWAQGDKYLKKELSFIYRDQKRV